MKLKVVSTLFLLILTLISPFSIPFASSDTNMGIKAEKINPGSFYYSIKRVWEKAIGYLTFSDQNKFDYQQSLLNKRLSELKFVVDNKVLSELETSSQRFAYQAGVLVGQLKKMDNKEKNAKVLEDFEKYKFVLNELRDNYSANSSFWMLLQHDINTLNILSDQLK